MADSANQGQSIQQGQYCSECGASLENPSADGFCERCRQRRVPSERAGDFEAHAGEERIGLVAEFWDFLKHNKKWWLLPILVVLLGFGVLILLSGTAAAPFIYTLF